MKIMVTGATGFVGRHVVAKLIQEGHEVIAIARDSSRAKTLPWFKEVEFIACDLHHNDQMLWRDTNIPDVLIHLAWPGLPNYRDFFHINENLPSDLAFLRGAVDSGIPHIAVAGTCLEYGMQYGPLTETMETKPITTYGLAKDMLRKSLQMLSKDQQFILQWVRLFYMYGEGQNPKSLLAQLDTAIAADEKEFKMSQGDQLRDYLSISKVADYFAALIAKPSITGIINCCSGTPISVVDLVKQRCAAKNSQIRLVRGVYPYPDYEPLAFWGVPGKLQALAE